MRNSCDCLEKSLGFMEYILQTATLGNSFEKHCPIQSIVIFIIGLIASKPCRREGRDRDVPLHQTPL